MASAQERANAIRALSFDAVEKANSGHPGMPMGMATIAEVLWGQHLKHNPLNPNWPNRDRFILSNGHGSMLQYALLHLSGYDLSINDLKDFRQLDSKTPGHPEHGDTPGVEATTGPLGQGLAMGVGMAVAEKALAGQFNRPKHNIVDNYTYVFVGDGCIMEGVSHEAASLAGTLELGKLIVFYDDNGISIDGEVKNWFQDDTKKRFEAYQWQVIDAIDGHDPNAIGQAIEKAKTDLNRPTLIVCKTTIGYGSPQLAGSAKSHGAPMGEAEVQATRKQLNWPYAPFEIPDFIYQSFDAKENGQKLEASWQQQLDAYTQAYPELAHELKRRLKGESPKDFSQKYLQSIAELITDKSIATRKASEHCLNALSPFLPELFGGSADLTGSNNTKWQDAKAFNAKQTDGQYLYYGVREFAMCSMLNGMSLYGGFLPFAGTFLVFADYGKNAIRLSALMQQRVVYVLTHDSIGLGEDGPTHQPIEQAAMLRLTPGLSVWRPACLLETAGAWQQSVLNDGPSALLLSRQGLPALHQDIDKAPAISRGGYILYENSQTPALILIATGSEVSLALAAAEKLAAEGNSIRVVSMPCVEAFLMQNGDYQKAVLPKGVPRIAIEASHKDYWYKFVGLEGRVIGLTEFGLSAPAQEIYQVRGITVEHIYQEAKTLL